MTKLTLPKPGAPAGIRLRPEQPRPNGPKAAALAEAKKAPGRITALPTQKAPAVKDLASILICLYGERKIGKTLLSEMFPECLHVLFEPGGKGFEAYKQEVNVWTEFQDVVTLLEKTDQFPTVAIDTADVAYDQVFAWGCEQRGIEYPRNDNFGDDWKYIENEYTGALSRIIRTGRGVIFISHAVKREFTSREFGVVNKLVPSFSSAAYKYCNGIADLILYFGYYGAERYMTISGSEDLEAGTRLKHNFWVKGKVGVERVHSIPAGRSEEEAYANLMKAFANEQPTSGEPELATVLTNTRKPRIKKRV